MTSRRTCSRRSGDLQAAGTPRKYDCALVVTFSQFTTPVSEHTSAAPEKWAAVRYDEMPRPTTASPSAAYGRQRAGSSSSRPRASCPRRNAARCARRLVRSWRARAAIDWSSARSRLVGWAGRFGLVPVARIGAQVVSLRAAAAALTPALEHTDPGFPPSMLQTAADM